MDVTRALLLCLALVVTGGCARDGGPGTEPETTDPGLLHVHGMGVNPADGRLYAATHTGVFRVDGPGDAVRIADRRQDTMGFTVVGPDHFLGSGHPDLREDLPPLLGLIESTDAARTWQAKSLLGEADFHALRHGHDRVYGFDSTGGRFMVSLDGLEWDTRSTTLLADFVVDPQDPDLVVATSREGLVRSSDGGRTWEPTDAPPQPFLLGWPDPASLWLLDVGGRVARSGDGGRTWVETGALGTPPEAFMATDTHLYAASGTSIVSSTDGGGTWEPVH